MYELRGTKERIEYIDLFRAFGIILMIMGHIGFGEIFDKFIHGFHMPMFFYISGFLYTKKTNITFKIYIVKKIKTLLVPYLFFGSIHYFIWLTYNQFSFVPLKHLLWNNSVNLPIAGALWFLTALFFTYCIYIFIDCSIKIEQIKAILIIILAVFGCCYKNDVFPFSICAACVGVGLFYLGVITKRYMELECIRKYIFDASGVCIFFYVVMATGIILINGYVNMRAGIYSNIILFWLGVVFAIFAGISISKLVYSMIKGTVLCEWLISVGRESIVYVCLNQLVILVFKNISILLPLQNKLFVRGFELCCTMLVLYMFSKIIYKTRLRFLVGK